MLYAQNELFSAELSAVRSHVDSLTQIVAVYSAVGGGWVDETAGRAPQPAGMEASAAPR